MTFLASWALWFSINLAATISPGPAFAMTVRMAVAHNRRAGLLFALGLGAGIAVQMTLIACGLAYLISSSILLFEIIKYAGAAYLIYIGGKALLSKKRAVAMDADQNVIHTPISDFRAFKHGLITNILNPKAMVFFTAMFTQFIDPSMPLGVLALYGLTAVVLESAWFAVVTIVLTDRRVKNKFMAAAHWIERVCGVLLISLGIKLALSKVSA